MSALDRPTIVLVHGAWHGPWCWDRLRSTLSRNGWETTAPQLPSAAFLAAEQETAGLREDIAALCDHLDGIDGPIALVAHSYGGMPVTEAAALRLGRIVQLIYVAAYLPREGDSLFSIHGGPTPEDVRGTVPVPDDPIDTFYNDVDAVLASEASQRLVPQSVRSWAEPVERADRAGTPSTYLLCERDHALPVPRQETFATRSDVLTRLDSGHSPFLSQPEHLAVLIERAITSATADLDHAGSIDVQTAPGTPGRPG